MFPFQHAAWRPQQGSDGQIVQIHPHATRQEALELTDEEDMATSVAPLPRAPFGSSQELTARFASMLTLKELRTERMLTARTKNCVMTRKYTRRRLARARRRHDEDICGSIAALQQNIAALERSRTLADSHTLLWRTNRSGAVVGMCREYFAQFSQGYDATSLSMVAQRDSVHNYMHSVASEDLVCREYRGQDKLLAQWEIYTKFHSDVICRLCQIELIDEEDDVVSVRCSAELDMGISGSTLENLYPAFYAQSQRDPKARQIVDGLIGKRYVMAFDKVFHFNRHGKWFAHESKVHLASSLMQVLEDPFAALEVLQASVMTEDGHWNTPDVDYMRIEQEEMYEMPKLML
jgi:hypothetical protein